MSYALILLLTLALRPLALDAQDPGFSPDLQSAHPTSLTGRWINEFYFAQPGQTPRLYWQIIELLSDGSTRHSYFSRNLVHGQPPHIPALFPLGKLGLLSTRNSIKARSL